MLKKSLSLGLIIVSLHTVSAQKRTIDLEENFRYISTNPKIIVYLVESSHNQVVLSGSNIESVMTKVIDDVLTIELSATDRPYSGNVVVYYKKKYQIANTKRAEEILSNTFIEIPRMIKL